MKDTIPPATAWVFEKYANEICDEAEVDREDKVLLAYEIQTHLQESWREGIRLDLTDERAERRAIEQFGTVRSVARSLNERDLRRLLLHESSRPTRVIAIFLFFFVLSCSRAMLEAFANNTFSNNVISTQENFFQPLVTLAFFYFVGHCGQYWSVVRAMFRDWFGMQNLVEQDGKEHKPFPAIFLTFLKWGVILAAVYDARAILATFFAPVTILKLTLSNHLWTEADITLHFIALLTLLIVLIPMGLFAFLSSSSEIFDWPRQKRERQKLTIWIFYTLPRLFDNRVLPHISGWLRARLRT